jgi:hypothetical protein
MAMRAVSMKTRVYIQEEDEVGSKVDRFVEDVELIEVKLSWYLLMLNCFQTQICYG